MSSYPTVCLTASTAEGWATAFPGFNTLAPTRSVPALGLLRTPWHRLLASRRSASGLERKLRKAAARGRPIVLGTTQQPYDPAAPARAPLAALRPFSGLQIRITTRSPKILDDLAVLIELDRDHAVSVDVVIADPDLRSGCLRDGLRLVRSLTREGILTRVHLPPSSGRRVFEAARRAGAFDVKTGETDASTDGSRRFQRLRLQHGFPAAQAGRG